MGTDDINPPQPPRRWTRILLVLSLALNLLIIGVVAGAVMGRSRDRGPDDRAISYGPFTRALTDADRQALRQSIRDKGDPRAHHRQLRAGFEAFLTELRSSPYDPDAAAAALTVQQQQIDAQITSVRAALLERIATMTDDERAGFADRLQEAVRHRKKFRPGD